MNTIRVLLADDHHLFRRGVAAVLAEHPEFQIVGEATDGLQAITLVRELIPDVVLMDISMPGMDGLEATKQIKAEIPQVKIVILTIGDKDQNLFEAIRGGAQGYLLKNVEPDQMVEMIRGAYRGEAAISKTAAAKILTEFSRQALAADAGGRSATGLTAREKEVLGLVAGGATNKEIAASLGVSPSTVKNHLQNIQEKLHLENRVQAATYALREGLAPIRPEQSPPRSALHIAPGSPLPPA